MQGMREMAEDKRKGQRKSHKGKATNKEQSTNTFSTRFASRSWLAA